MKVIPPTREKLIELRQEGTREEIANQYGVSVSTVRRWVRKYKLQRQRKVLPTTMKPSNLDWGVTIIDKAKMILGGRITESRDGYRLDNRACNTDDILLAAGLA